MTDTYHINDMEICFEFNPGYQDNWLCNVYLGKIQQTYSFIDEAHKYRIMCTYLNITYPPEQVYKELIKKILLSGKFRSSEMAIYDEYFGSDVDTLTARLKQRKQNQFELQRESLEAQQKEHSRKVITKLGITFWGSLIVEDIL